MARKYTPTRRRFLCTLASGVVLTPLLARRARGADSKAPLLSPDAPEATKVRYTETASQEKTAKGNTCATCGLYEGTYGSAQGPCQLFPDKQVKSAGWCNAWSPQL